MGTSQALPSKLKEESLSPLLLIIRSPENHTFLTGLVSAGKLQHLGPLLTKSPCQPVQVKGRVPRAPVCMGMLCHLHRGPPPRLYPGASWQLLNGNTTLKNIQHNSQALWCFRSPTSRKPDVEDDHKASVSFSTPQYTMAWPRFLMWLADFHVGD